MATAAESLWTSPPPQPGNYHATIPDWGEPYLYPARYKSLRGGRGSGKSHLFAQTSVLRMSHRLVPFGYPDEPVRIASCRDFQTNIKESVKQAVEGYIHAFGLFDEFDIQAFQINHYLGSHMFFPGVERSPDSFRSIEDVDVFWMEQAECLQDEMLTIEPAIRKSGSEVWAAWNPNKRTDWCWRRFVVNPQPGDVSTLVNFDRNPWESKEARETRETFRQMNPSQYPHVYLGQPDDAGGDKAILSYDMAQQCVRAYREGLHSAAKKIPAHTGLDIADGGEDSNAAVTRAGPCIEFADMFPAVRQGDFEPTAKRFVDKSIGPFRSSIAWFDATGVGSSMMKELERQRGGSRNWFIYRVLAGQPPEGADNEFSRDLTNGDQFFNRAAQLAWGLRMRAENTVRLLGGRNIDPNYCLFINPACAGSENALEAYLAQLTQPRWDYASRRQVRLTKAAKGEPSPDLFDATALAFAWDSENVGLSLRVPEA